MTRSFSCPALALAALVCSVSTKPALGALATLPTAGLAGASVVVGLAGAGNAVFNPLGGGPFFTGTQGLLGGFLLTADPSPATFLSGQLVIDYPAALEKVEAIGWFGNFAQDPALPAPPVDPGPFISTPGSYPVQQPNSLLSVTTTNTNGVLTISFNAPSGVAVDGAAPFNFLGVLFQNISGEELQWSVASGSPNFFEDTSATTFTCIPSGSVTPSVCGESTPPFAFTVSAVPEPATWGISALSFGAVLVYRWRRRSKVD